MRDTAPVKRVIVVGAGVVGLTCAIRLLEAGHRVDVVARDLPLESTSAVAAAIWYPYRALPQDRVTRWGARTYEVLTGLAAQAGTGVRMVPGTEVHRTPRVHPWWASAVPDLADPEALPDGYAHGWSFVAPVVEMPVYLAWLRARVEELDGTVTRLHLRDLPAHGGDVVVVNCSGLGARMLVGDPTVAPARGQVLHVEQVGIERWWLDSAGPTYVVPRSGDVVVGGTDEEGSWDPAPSPRTAAQILARAVAVEPALAGARVLRHRVGLRPVRPAVRVERDGGLVHCYGHGGAGVTLSWGCAEEVTALVAGEATEPDHHG